MALDDGQSIDIKHDQWLANPFLSRSLTFISIKIGDQLDERILSQTIPFLESLDVRVWRSSSSFRTVMS